MMRRLLAGAFGLFFAGLITVLANAPVPANLLLAPAATGGGGGCSQATTFLARTSGLDTAHQTAYTSMICSMVTNGVITGSLASSTFCGSKLDRFYLLGAPDSTTALLDICGHSSAVANGSPTFTANHGFAGVDASQTIFIDTGFNPSTAGGNWVLNGAHLAVWSLTNATSGGSGGVAIGAGASGSSQLSNIYPHYSDGNTYGDMNDAATDTGHAVSDSLGYYVSNRTGASAVSVYKNASLLYSPNTASTSLSPVSIYLLALHRADIGTRTGSALQIAVAHLGGALSSTDITNIKTAVCLYSSSLSLSWSGC